MSRQRLWLPLVAMSISYCGWGAAWAGDFDSFYGEVYVQRESGPLKADLYIPRGEGPFPGVLVVHMLAVMDQQVIDKTIAFLAKQLRTGDGP